MLIEVKSSTNRNSRTKRQEEAILALQSFLETDVGAIGPVEMLRRALPEPEEDHTEVFNRVLDLAADGQSCEASPEPGVSYIALATSISDRRDLAAVGLERCVAYEDGAFVYFPNEIKSAMAWANYQPFTLAIRNPETLYCFLTDQVYVAVSVDEAAIVEHAANHELEIEVVLDGTVGFLVKPVRGPWAFDGPLTMSQHFAQRIWIETSSLSWFMSNTAKLVKSWNAELKSELEDA